MKKLALMAALLLMGTVCSAQTKNLPDPNLQRKTLTVMQTFKQRKSVREYSAKQLSDQDLSDLLWAAQGKNREDGKLTSPTAMNQVPGGSRQLARVRRVPSSPPLGSLRAWMGHSHWLCPLPTTCLLLPGSPPRPAGIRHKGGPVRATETHSSPAVEVRAPIPQNGVYKTHVCKHKTSFEKKKRVRRTSLVVQWLRSRVPMQQQELAPWSRETPHTARQLSPCATPPRPQ